MYNYKKTHSSRTQIETYKNVMLYLFINYDGNNKIINYNLFTNQHLPLMHLLRRKWRNVVHPL
jgi:hypothetical protein